jgi:hypothetical protein
LKRFIDRVHPVHYKTMQLEMFRSLYHDFPLEMASEPIPRAEAAAAGQTESEDEASVDAEDFAIGLEAEEEPDVFGPIGLDGEEFELG